MDSARRYDDKTEVSFETATTPAKADDEEEPDDDTAFLSVRILDRALALAEATAALEERRCCLLLLANSEVLVGLDVGDVTTGSLLIVVPL